MGLIKRILQSHLNREQQIKSLQSDLLPKQAAAAECVEINFSAPEWTVAMEAIKQLAHQIGRKYSNLTFVSGCFTFCERSPCSSVKRLHVTINHRTTLQPKRRTTRELQAGPRCVFLMEKVYSQKGKTKNVEHKT